MSTATQTRTLEQIAPHECDIGRNDRVGICLQDIAAISITHIAEIMFVNKSSHSCQDAGRDDTGAKARW